MTSRPRLIDDLVSFVIPAHNEEALLPSVLEAIRGCADALFQEARTRYEIVVANDASTDCTAAIAAHHGAQVVDIEVRQIAGARNAGARASRGRWLIFVDADTWVNPPAVVGAVLAMQNGAVGGGSAFRFDRPIPLYARVLEPLCVIAYRLIRFASGSFLFCSREAFDAVGGFDESLYAAEEATMCRALRKHGRFIILREPVTTSGRKLRMYAARELFGPLIRVGLRPSCLKRRDGLDIWYRQRDESAP